MLISAWLPVVLGLLVIFLESSNYFSSSNTGAFLSKILTGIFGHHLNPSRMEALNFFLRKCGHFLGYGVLGLLFFRAIRNTFSLCRTAKAKTSRPSLQRWALAAILCTAMVAAADEWHQSFLASRTGAFHDVVLDTTGAAVLLILVLIRYAAKRRITEPK